MEATLRQWTLEQRQQQAAAIRRWKPWQQSTGPKSDLGKHTAKMNAQKHGMRSLNWQIMKKILREQAKAVNWLYGSFMEY